MQQEISVVDPTTEQRVGRRVLTAAAAALEAHAQSIDDDAAIVMVRLEVRINRNEGTVRRVIVQLESEYDPRG